ncbi:MAG: MerR family transcriptional regulator [Chloroflexota bacterium]
MLKIGDFSNLTRVSVKTLRYYDEIGLLKPARVDRFTNYRYYTFEQLPRLNRILALKDLGLSLDQIGRLLTDDLTLEQLRGMLRLKQAELEGEVAETQAHLARVEARLNLIEKENQMSNYDVVIKQVEPQTVAAIREVVPTFGHQRNLWRELAGYLLTNKTKATAPSLTLYHDAEYKDQHVDIETATPVMPPLPTTERVKVRELPGGEMACTVHQGSYETIGEAYSALITWIEVNGYQIVGPGREVYLRCPDNDYEEPEAIGYSEYSVDDPADFLTEIQFPVAKA